MIDNQFKCINVPIVLDWPGVEIVCVDIINLKNWTKIM